MVKFLAALDQLQSDSCTLSDTVKVWLSLINDEELQQFKRDVKKRFESAMQPFFFLAFLTDHRKFDSDVQLNDTQENDAEEWLESYDHDLFQSFVKFQLRTHHTDLYPNHLFSKSMKGLHPRAWWTYLQQKAGKRQDDAQTNFCKFMVALHSCPSSSANLERWFSTFVFVWSKTRNRLGHEKAMKLVKIFKS